ncbi:hypothetical protein TcWFU_005428 [Taenia crassiceps]|uniref:G-patch domain-containing protein n=1 Tax=Taenia crassiceps TaxID=6207 RepID=A0ABR4Q5U4_9CEST
MNWFAAAFCTTMQRGRGSFDCLNVAGFYFSLLLGDMWSHHSDFAVNQLKKFGWSEGDGLGKNKDGISKPIKASMKFSRRGLGATCQTTAEIDELPGVNGGKGFCDPSVWPRVKFVSAEEFRMDACSSYQKKESGNIDFQPQRGRDGSEDVAASQKRSKRERRECDNGGASDTRGNLGKCAAEVKEEREGNPVMEKSKCPTKVTGKRGKLCSQLSLHSLSDTYLLKLGNGRTAHPAARFGIRCGGKLARAAQYL